MDISLPPEIEQIALEAVAVGRFKSVEEFVVSAVRQCEEVSGVTDEESASQASKMPYAEWEKRFNEFLKNRRATTCNDVDDSRESIYPDR